MLRAPPTTIQNRAMRRVTSNDMGRGVGVVTIAGDEIAAAHMNAAHARIDTDSRGEGVLSYHSRCQSAIIGSKVRWTIALSNQREAKLRARNPRHLRQIEHARHFRHDVLCLLRGDARTVRRFGHLPSGQDAHRVTGGAVEASR